MPSVLKTTELAGLTQTHTHHTTGRVASPGSAGLANQPQSSPIDIQLSPFLRSASQIKANGIQWKAMFASQKYHQCVRLSSVKIGVMISPMMPEQ